MCLLLTGPPKEENRRMKKLLKTINIGIKKPNRKISEFKFLNNTKNVRKKVLCEIQKLDVNIGVISISKDSVTAEL